MTRPWPGNADEVLVYDRPIGSGGIPWRDPQAWRKDTQRIPGDDEGKESLYHRLINGPDVPGSRRPGT
jgi:hypothetical protein